MSKATQVLSKLDEAEELFNLFIKRDGKYSGPWNKKPMKMKDIDELEKRIAKAKIPSVDMGSARTLKQGQSPK